MVKIIELTFMDWKTILFQYSTRIAGNRWDEEDLTQDAWLKLNDALRKDPNRPLTKAFLYRIVKNTWIDMQRKKHIETVPFTQNYGGSSLEDSLVSRELLELLAERLPPKMAVILLLMDVFDFTAKETADLIGMKDSAVQVSLGRARRKLRSIAHLLDKPVPATSEPPVHFDALVEAFRRHDPYQIYEAYIGVSREGIQLTQLLMVDGRLHFTFKDPDGSLFHVVSK